MKTFIEFRTVLLCTLFSASLFFLGLVSVAMDQRLIGLIVGFLLALPALYNLIIVFVNYRSQKGWIRSYYTTIIEIEARNLTYARSMDRILERINSSDDPEFVYHSIKDYFNECIDELDANDPHYSPDYKQLPF